MKKKYRAFILTLASFFGTTIGVGIFALPYSYAISPLISLAILSLTALILMSLYTMYIDILLEKGIGIHQLPGIVQKIWGKKMKNSVAVLLLVGRTGILFLYTLILADFGSLVIENIIGVIIPPSIIGTVTTVLGSIAIARRTKLFSRVELYLSATIIFILGTVSVSGLIGAVSISPRFLTSALLPDGGLFLGSFVDFIPHIGSIYGVSIGAMSGIAAIPALKEITEDQPTLFRATRIGTVLVAILYALFSLFVILASSPVSQDALHGLGNSWWVTLLAIGGFFSVLTSYLGVGNSLFEVYQHDYSMPNLISWTLTVLPPLALFIIGFNDFVDIAAIIGGVIGGTEGLIILATYWKLEENNNTMPTTKKLLASLLALVLGIGLFLSL